MTNETGQGLERLSWLPDRDAADNGVFIAGQKYYDVYFTGGEISGITPTGLPTPLAIADGGTGQITANAALNALLPTQTGHAGEVLKTNGTNTSWSADIDTGITQLTGDVTAGPGSGSQVATLATVNAGIGTFGSATQAPQITLNGKGLATAASNVTITPAASSITGAADITKTDDTNVTLTLGGTPVGSTLKAVSFTLGWTGILAVERGGTGRSTSTTAYGLIAAGTTATGAQQTLAAGATTEILVGGGASALPVWTTAEGSGAPVRATSPTLTTPVLGVAAATSVNFGQDALNYYDEGTWVPTITTDGTLGTPAYLVQVASFTRIGRQVFYQFYVSLSSWAGSPTGNVFISGLPFTSANTTNLYGGGIMHTYVVVGLAVLNYGITIRTNPNTTTIELLQNGSTSVASLTAAQAGGTPIFIGSGSYHV